MIKIVVAGEKQSGKTSVLEMLNQKSGIFNYQAEYISMDDIINRQINFLIGNCNFVADEEQYFKSNKKIFNVPDLFKKTFKNNVKELFGNDIFLKCFRNRERELSSQCNILLCDTLRTVEEYSYFRAYKWIILYIHCPESIRAARCQNIDYNTNSDEELQHIYSGADFVIHNNSTKEFLNMQVSKVLVDIVYENFLIN